MNYFLSILISIPLVQYGYAQAITNKTIIYSQQVKDSFELYVSTPATIDINKTYDVIYYCDANLKSGNTLRELISGTDYSVKVDKTIFVGVQQIGNFHVLRRRDFILPSINNGDTTGSSANYGQAEHYYQFLKTELIPMINSKYKTSQYNNSILGHSLGGLFAFYCLFKNEDLFTNYFALSPALWVDHYSIYDFNKLDKGINTPKNLYFSSGSMEILNHIKTGTDNMFKFLEEKKYKNVKFKYEVHEGKTHNSQVEMSLGYILK